MNSDEPKQLLSDEQPILTNKPNIAKNPANDQVLTLAELSQEYQKKYMQTIENAIEIAVNETKQLEILEILAVGRDRDRSAWGKGEDISEWLKNEQIFYLDMHGANKLADLILDQVNTAFEDRYFCYVLYYMSYHYYHLNEKINSHRGYDHLSVAEQEDYFFNYQNFVQYHHHSSQTYSIINNCGMPVSYTVTINLFPFLLTKQGDSPIYHKMSIRVNTRYTTGKWSCE